MITFDASKITYDYVYVTKITKFSIEVSKNDSGEQYTPENIKHNIRNNKTIVPIHRKVFALYTKNTSLVEFSGEGRRACIFYYDGYVLTIDIYKPYGLMNGTPVKETDWTSVNIEALQKIVALIDEGLDKDKDSKVYIDGETIFFTDKNQPIYKFKSNQNFWLQPVRYIQLSKMAVKVRTEFAEYMRDKKPEKFLPQSNKIEEEKLHPETLAENKKDEKSAKAQAKKDSNSETLIVLKSGTVLAYNPIPEEDPNFVVYSAVMSDVDTEVKKTRFGMSFGIPSSKILVKIENSENPVYFNLLFALRAGKTIGEHYGFDETDFLDIPSIILDTGILNLKNDISYQSRANFPLNLNQWDCLAYLMRFFHKEKDLNIYRDLVGLFSFTAKYGFVDKSNTGKVFKDGKSIEDLPKRHIHISHKDEAEKEGFKIKNPDILPAPSRNKHSRRSGRSDARFLDQNL